MNLVINKSNFRDTVDKLKQEITKKYRLDSEDAAPKKADITFCFREIFSVALAQAAWELSQIFPAFTFSCCNPRHLDIFTDNWCQELAINIDSWQGKPLVAILITSRSNHFSAEHCFGRYAWLMPPTTESDKNYWMLVGRPPGGYLNQFAVFSASQSKEDLLGSLLDWEAKIRQVSPSEWNAFCQKTALGQSPEK